MAKVKDNLVTEGLSGMLGGQIVFRHLRNGMTIVTKSPDFSNRVFSKGQLNHQSRFQQASAYARVAAKTQPIYAKLAQQTGQPAYNIALSDWFKPPVIHSIKRQDGRILVDATDKVLVTRVLVRILNEQGETLEHGEAIPGSDGWWEYLTAAAKEGNVIAEAFDLAGNVTKQEA